MQVNNNNWEWNACDLLHYFKTKIDNLENTPGNPGLLDKSLKPKTRASNLRKKSLILKDEQIKKDPLNRDLDL